jgi:hypothetical protein
MSHYAFPREPTSGGFSEGSFWFVNCFGLPGYFDKRGA